jgi:hypothetical protein
MVGVASVFAFACGDDESGPKYPSADSFCDAKATLECAKPTVGTCPITKDACHSARKNACLAAASAATGQGRAYTAGNAEACLNLVSGAYDKPTDTATQETYSSTCGKVFSGSVAKGGQCHTEFDCTGALVCDLVKADPRCADKRIVTAQNGCANSGDICDTGLFCNISGTPLCQPKIALGGQCGATLPCIDTAFCNGTSTCAALAQNGNGCTANTQCASNFCNTAAGNLCANRLFPTLYSADVGTCRDYGGT